MANPRRSLQDIRTLTGRVAKAAIPYKAFLRISHIEMEKARRNRESESARQLIADIAARLAEIEAEKAALLQAVGERPRGPKTEPAPRSRGLKIRY